MAKIVHGKTTREEGIGRGPKPRVCYGFSFQSGNPAVLQFCTAT